jgi:hypothetical protein
MAAETGDTVTMSGRKKARDVSMTSIVPGPSFRHGFSASVG